MLSNPFPYHIAQNSVAAEIRFRQVVTSARQPDHNMDQTKKPVEDKQHKAT